MKDDTRIALLEQSITHLNETLIRIERKIDFSIRLSVGVVAYATLLLTIGIMLRGLM